MTPTLFCEAKRKKGNKGKKERVSKQKLLKGCNQIQNVIAIVILELVDFKYLLSANLGGRPILLVSHCPSTLKSISPALILIF